MNKRTSSSRLVIGWREWISIPSLQIPYIKAKVDTGAKTSALHAVKIETFTERGQPRVRFFVHPLQKQRNIIVACEADVVDRRIVCDSGGHRERRFVIEVPVIIGGMEWPIEFTLTNRETMAFRMLLGRSAMKNRIIVEPGKSYLLGQPLSPEKAFKRPRKKL